MQFNETIQWIKFEDGINLYLRWIPILTSVESKSNQTKRLEESHPRPIGCDLYASNLCANINMDSQGVTMADNTLVLGLAATEINYEQQEVEETAKGASVTYPIIFLMGILANSSVLITIIFGHKLTRTIVLIANMSTADLLLLFTGCYLRYYDRFVSIANTPFCKIFNAADIMFLQISSLTILAMSYERLVKVTDRGHLTRESKAKPQIVICGLIWLFAFVISLPAAFYAELHSNVIACVSTYSESVGIRYNSVLFATTYCIPGKLCY